MNKYDWFVIVSLIVWVAETAFFGFHAVAITPLEHLLDQVCLILTIYGGLGGVATAIKTQVFINNVRQDQ